MQLHFVRHASTGVTERSLKPEDDLSGGGFRQASRLAARFAGVAIAAIYASPYQRALSTAGVLAGEFPGLELRVDERLKEIPLWASPADVQDDTKKQYLESKALLETTQSGALGFLEEVREEHAGEQVVVVAHGNFIRATVGVLLKMPLESVVRLTVDHTSITTFEWVDDGVLPFYLLHRFNDTAHLEIMDFGSLDRSPGQARSGMTS